MRVMEDSSPIVRFGLWFGSIFAMLSGSVSGSLLLNIALKARATGAWPSVPGVITRADVDRRAASSYYADVSYLYEVGGREFTGHRIRTSDFGYNSRDAVVQTMQGLAPGQRVAVHFDPGDPAQSVLQPGAGSQEYMLLVVPAVVLTTGIAMLSSLLRHRTRRGGSGAKALIEDELHDPTATKRPSAAKAEKGPRPHVPVHRAIIRAWGDLLASRESLLLRAYSEMLLTRDPDDFDPATIAEARQRYDATYPATVPTESARAVLEARAVLAARAIAAWLVFWTTIVPAGIVGWTTALRIHHRIGFKNIQHFLQFIIAELFIFLILGFMGFFIQTILTRPFVAVVNRLLTSIKYTGHEPIEDEPGHSTGGRPG